MNNQVIDVMSTVMTNTNTKNNTIMFNFTDSLHIKKKYVTSILIYFDIFKKGDEYQDYNDHLINAFMVHLQDVPSEHMPNFLIHLTGRYTIKHPINGEILHDEWLKYQEEQKNKIVPLPPCCNP